MIISSFRPVIGGAERLTERLSRALRSRGVDVIVMTRRYVGLARSAVVGEVPVHRLGFASTTKFGALSFAAHVFLLLATRLRHCRIVHVQNPETPLLVGFVVKLLLRRRLFVTLQNDPEVLFTAKKLTGPLRLRLVRALADVVGVQNEQMKECLLRRGFPVSRVHLLPNSVDITTFRPPTPAERRVRRRALGIREDTTVFLFLGRLASQKRVDLLLRAWSSSRGVRNRSLLVVGDGSESFRVRALAEDLGLHDVRFHGSTDDVLQYLYAADVFVLPSMFEGLSNALLEAMAVGLTVVVSNHSANVAVVQDMTCGLTFSVGDFESLKDALIRAESELLRRKLRVGAVEAARRYSIQDTAEHHRRLYDVLSERAHIAER